MTHSLPLPIAAAMQELPASERDGLRRQAIRTALENMPAAEAEQILAYADALSKKSGGAWRVTELAALETLAAIAATLSAMRAIERHGGAEILNRAFAGFAQLPAPSDSATSWWAVLQVERTATPDEIRAAYRALARGLHPDNQLTGNAEQFIILQKAYELAQDEKGF